MNHEEYVTSIHKQQSFIRRLYKRRSDISSEIEKLTKEYYKDIVGKFFYVSPEARNKFKDIGIGNVSDGYHFVYGVNACSNYASDDKVEITLLVKKYGVTTHGFDEIIGVEVYEKNWFFSPSVDVKGEIEPLIVSEEEALKPLHDYYNKMVFNSFQCYML